MLKRAFSFTRKHNQAISLAIGLFGIVFGLIQYFYPYTSKPDLKFYLRETIDVVSVNQRVESMEVLFNGRNIVRDSLGLKIYKIRLKNDGKAPVTQESYASIPFGLKLGNGSLISARHESSNVYLKENISPLLTDSSQLTLGKCIFEHKQFVDFELLVIHQKNQIPAFSSIGKISGIESIEVINEKDSDFTLWDFITVIFWIVTPFVLIGLVLTGIGVVIERIQRYFRKRSILNFYEFPVSPLNEAQRLIVSVITEIGYKASKPVFKLIVSGEGNLEKLYEKELANQATIDNFRRMIKSKEYYIKDITTSSIEEYDSDEKFVLDEIFEFKLAEKGNYQVEHVLLTELKILLEKYS